MTATPTSAPASTPASAPALPLTHRPYVAAALLAFAGLGIYWGIWAACLPDISRRFADRNDGLLGQVLLCVALGALPGMLVTGRLKSSRMMRGMAVTMAAFGGAVLLVPHTDTLLWLGLSLGLVGMTSGALDVVMNTATAEVEQHFGIRRMHLAHGAFSAAFCVASIGTGVARDQGVTYQQAVTAGGWVLLALALVIGWLTRRTLPAHAGDTAPADLQPATTGWRRPLLVLGALCALGYLVEDGMYIWSALHLERTLQASATIGGLGPGLLAFSAAIGRGFGQALTHRFSDAVLLRAAGILAGIGAGIFAFAPHWTVALPGLILAGGAIALISPAMFGIAGRIAPAGKRSAAISLVALCGYLGFLIGPSLFGALSNLVGLRATLGIVGGFSLLFAAFAPRYIRRLLLPPPPADRA